MKRLAFNQKAKAKQQRNESTVSSISEAEGAIEEVMTAMKPVTHTLTFQDFYGLVRCPPSTEGAFEVDGMWKVKVFQRREITGTPLKKTK